MGNKWIAVGSFLMALAVALGALGAHKLKELVSAAPLESFKTGVLYHIIHALAIIIVGVISASTGKNLNVVGYLFVAGIVLFSGSIYGLSTQEISELQIGKVLGPITPIGGLLFMAAWVMLGISMLKSNA